MRLLIPSLGRSRRNLQSVLGMKTKLNMVLEQRMLYLMLLVRRSLLVFIAKRPLMKFGKHLKLSMLVLKNFVKKNIKCLRKNLMNSKFFQMSWLNKFMLD